MKRIITVLLVLLLTGCSQGSSSLSDISQINRELSEHSFSSYDNLTFDCKPERINTDEVYIITMKSRTWKSSDESTKNELKKYVDSIYDTNIDTKKMIFSFEPTEQELESDILLVKKYLSSVKVSASIGLAFAEHFNGDMSALAEIADKKMYEDKDRYYKMTGKVRRT